MNLQAAATALKLADAARDLADGADQLALVLAGGQTQKTGTVRITASTPVAVHILPPILLQMRQALPEIQVELVASNAVSNLLRREADIAVRMVRPEQGNLIAQKIGDVSMGAFAHRAYLAQRSPICQPLDLFDHALIGGDTDSSTRDGFKAAGFEVGKEVFALRSDDLIVQWQAIRAGLGIGFVAHFTACLDTDVVQVLPDALRIPPLPMWLAVHREIRTSQRIRTAYDFLVGAVPRMMEGRGSMAGFPTIASATALS